MVLTKQMKYVELLSRCSFNFTFIYIIIKLLNVLSTRVSAFQALHWQIYGSLSDPSDVDVARRCRFLLFGAAARWF